MNPEVDEFLGKARKWHEELLLLRDDKEHTFFIFPPPNSPKPGN